MTDLETTIFNANKRRFADATSPLKSHGPDHHWRVYQNALKLAELTHAKFDPEVLAAAALLHDLAAYYPEQTGEDYHEYDHKFAEEVLKEVDFPDNKTAAVLEAIAAHGSDTKYKSFHESSEATLLRDADKMDVFGPVGVARIIMARSIKGDSLAQIVEDYLDHGYLERKRTSITSKEARELVQDDYRYSLGFFKTLKRRLGLVGLGH